MEYQRFEHVKASLVNAAADQVLDLEAIIRGLMARQFAEVALARRTKATVLARQCPHCTVQDAMLARQGAEWPPASPMLQHRLQVHL